MNEVPWQIFHDMSVSKKVTDHLAQMKASRSDKEESEWFARMGKRMQGIFEGTAVWDECNGWSGRIEGLGTVFKQPYAVLQSIRDHVSVFANNPNQIKARETSVTRRQPFFDPVRMAHPHFTPSKQLALSQAARKAALKQVDTIIAKTDLKDNKASNVDFLLKLGSMRNWKEGCAICLGDDQPMVPHANVGIRKL